MSINPPMVFAVYAAVLAIDIATIETNAVKAIRTKHCRVWLIRHQYTD
jgi:hypothetical protein